MKYILSILIFLVTTQISNSQCSEASYRIFGEITTVDNHLYKGFITWGTLKNYWIDFFEASKIQNPYAHYFDEGDGIIFHRGNQTFAKPPVNDFYCRFGYIRLLRPIGEKEIQLILKNGQKLNLCKGNMSDIGYPVEISTSTETKQLKWEHISEIHFMQADTSCVPPSLNPVAGILKSSQGTYKGIITWNYNKKRNAEKENAIHLFLNKMQKIIKDKNNLKVLPQEHLFKNPVILKTDILYPVGNLMVNMPNIGRVIVSPSQFIELEIIPLSQLSLPTYENFGIPYALEGEVITRNNERIGGKLVYDLDETLSVETLDGQNDNISYRIPFQYLHSIEPKNYKYSYITFKNGNHLSLGDAQDVNRDNNGIIVFGKSDIPTYIPWEEVKIVTFK